MRSFRAQGRARSVFVVALIVFHIGIFWGLRNWRFARGALRASGVVVSLVERPATDDAGTTYAAVVEFTAEGKALRVEGKVGTSLDLAPAVGSQVPVYYLSGHPEDARLSTANQVWSFPILFIAVGGTFMVVSMIGSFRKRRA